jgi:acetyl esterase/lipase
MPTYRARLIRFLIRYSIGRKLRRAGLLEADRRKLDDLMVRSQRLPRGTKVSPIAVGDLPAEWVQGPNSASDAAILYLHGGGFIMGSPATHRELAARVSSAGGACVLSLGYRLLPEYPFPAALDDARTAYRWLLERGYASDQLIIGGDSSGAGLALQTLISLRDEGVPLPCAGFFMSPVTDWVEPGGESFATRAALDSLVSPAQCRQTSSMYVASHGDSPLLRPTETNLAGLPPLWIQVGDHEVLLSDAERLADRAAEAGVEVDFKIWPGMWHVFQSAAQYVPESRQSIEELGLFLQRRLGRRPSLPCNQAENRTTFEPTIVRANVFEEEPAAK